ncbi:MAG: hypothetical protein ABSF62_02770 [Bryobacteraceae bacterium]|jgi:hypothetical protein
MEPEKWRIETNDRNSKLVASVMSVATGSLVLPVLFLRDFLGIPREKALLQFLNCWVYAAWICFAVSIFLGLAYTWLSVKWIKLAWGQKIVLSEGRLECLLDTSFVGMAVLFLAGIGSLIRFFVTFHA